MAVRLKDRPGRKDSCFDFCRGGISWFFRRTAKIARRAAGGTLLHAVQKPPVRGVGLRRNSLATSSKQLPRLRADLEILRTAPDEFMLRDPLNSEVFQFGFTERAVTRLLDGKHSHVEIREQLAKKYNIKLSRRFLEEFVEQLRTRGLLEGEDPAPQYAEARTMREPGTNTPLNVFFDLLTVAFGWLINPWCIVPILGLVTLAMMALWQNFSELSESLETVIDELGVAKVAILWIGEILLLISLPNAILTGIACRRLGGRIESFGLHFYRNLVPYFGCNTGESVVYMTNAGRWTMLSLRIWSRLAIASLVILGWTMTTQGSLLHWGLTVLIVPSLIGLFLRLNIFNPMEACSMLSYGLGVYKLRERALAETAAWLTLRISPEALSSEERFWFRLYGLGVYFWRILVLAVVIFVGGPMVANYLGGIGLALGVLLILWWYHEDIWRLLMLSRALRWLLRGGPWYVRWPVRLAILACIVAVGFVPYNIEVGGDFRMVPAAEYGVRAPIAGQLSEILVSSGDHVEKDQVIAKIADHQEKANVEIAEAKLAKAKAELDLLNAGNRPETIEVARNKYELAQRSLEYYEDELERLTGLAETNTVSDARLQQTRLDHDEAVKLLAAANEELQLLTSGARAEEIAAAEATVQAMQAELAHYKKQLDLTTISSPGTGQIVTGNLSGRVTQYVQPGDLIALVQDASKLKVEIAATEDAAALIDAGQMVKLRFTGLDGAQIVAYVDRVALRAVDDSQLSLSPYRTDREQMAESSWQRARVHYVPVYATIDPQTNERLSEILLPDMTGYARVVIRRDQLWRAMARHLNRFFKIEVWSWMP